MNVIIIDERTNFLNDVKNRLALCDDTDIEVIAYLPEMDNIDDYIDNADLVLVADNIASDPDFSVPSENTVGYATNDEYKGVLYQHDLENIGFMRKPKALVDYLISHEEDGFDPELIVRKNTKPVEKERKKGSNARQRDTHIVHNVSRAPRKQVRSSPKKNFEEEYDEYGNDEYEEDDDTDEFDDEGDEPVPLHDHHHNSPKVNDKINIASKDDVEVTPDRAKVITVYSAKGGVGKTTLASEIGAYLALTCKKRGRLRCCVIDYNIDFGDVTTTLGFDAEGVNMAMWAAEIEERRTQGKSTEYTAKEIQENFLQRKVFDDKTEIFGLIAPPTHEDSMDIHEEELYTMLDNIVRNGGFDYVICDTGNNTRDSSIIALDFADYVFMVLTQDISTINCNDSFLTTIRRMKYDESRIRVVINNVLPSKETAISVHDIESFVSFPTAAIIRHHSDVIKANNQSVPLVFRASHEYTKEIRNIISVIINDGEVVADSKKGHSLFKRNAGGSEKKRVRR